MTFHQAMLLKLDNLAELENLIVKSTWLMAWQKAHNLALVDSRRKRYNAVIKKLEARPR